MESPCVIWNWPKWEGLQEYMEKDGRTEISVHRHAETHGKNVLRKHYSDSEHINKGSVDVPEDAFCVCVTGQPGNTRSDVKVARKFYPNTAAFFQSPVKGNT